MMDKSKLDVDSGVLSVISFKYRLASDPSHLVSPLLEVSPQLIGSLLAGRLQLRSDTPRQLLLLI